MITRIPRPAGPDFQRLIRKSLVVLALVFLRLSAFADTPAAFDTARLIDFRQEAEAHNAQDPLANLYRAGYYNGYLAGILDSLQGKRVCFRECICELDKLVARHLAEHPEAGNRPVVEWPAPLLEERYPCR
jgi:hypothetical protein